MLFGALKGTGKIYHCEIYRDILLLPIMARVWF